MRKMMGIFQGLTSGLTLLRIRSVMSPFNALALLVLLALVSAFIFVDSFSIILMLTLTFICVIAFVVYHLNSFAKLDPQLLRSETYHSQQNQMALIANAAPEVARYIAKINVEPVSNPILDSPQIEQRINEEEGQ